MSSSHGHKTRKKKRKTGTKVKQGMNAMYVFLQKPWPPPTPPSYNLHFATFIEKKKNPKHPQPTFDPPEKNPTLPIIIIIIIIAHVNEKFCGEK
jgi:hypothetical protein